MVLSAIAPETIVAVVAQNTRLNMKFDQSKLSYAVKTSKPGFPIKPIISSPRNSPKPIRINVTVPIQKSIRFFIRIFPEFFALAKPVSTIAKPACIQNTNAAPARNHIPKTKLLTSSLIVLFLLLYFFCVAAVFHGA